METWTKFTVNISILALLIQAGGNSQIITSHFRSIRTGFACCTDSWLELLAVCCWFIEKLFMLTSLLSKIACKPQSVNPSIVDHRINTICMRDRFLENVFELWLLSLTFSFPREHCYSPGISLPCSHDNEDNSFEVHMQDAIFLSAMGWFPLII